MSKRQAKTVVRTERHALAVPRGEVLSLASPLVVGSEEGCFTGIASVFGSVAEGMRGPTRFSKGAFVETLAKSGGKVPLLWQHFDNEPLGVARLTVTEEGLSCAGRITQTAQGRDVTALLRDGAIDGLSIGFDADDVHYEKHPDGSGMVRIVDRASLHEVSLVTFPADPAARVRTVHRLAFDVLAKLPEVRRDVAGKLIEALLLDEHEAHEGKVFSAKNLQRMKEAIAAMLDLVQIVEPDFVLTEAEQRKPKPPPAVYTHPDAQARARRSAALRAAEVSYAERLAWSDDFVSVRAEINSGMKGKPSELKEAAELIAKNGGNWKAVPQASSILDKAAKAMDRVARTRGTSLGDEVKVGKQAWDKVHKLLGIPRSASGSWAEKAWFESRESDTAIADLVTDTYGG